MTTRTVPVNTFTAVDRTQRPPRKMNTNARLNDQLCTELLFSRPRGCLGNRIFMPLGCVNTVEHAERAENTTKHYLLQHFSHKAVAPVSFLFSLLVPFVHLLLWMKGDDGRTRKDEPCS